MKINYSNLTFSQLVTKIGNSRFWDLPAMLQEVLNKLSGRVETLENAPTPSGGIETLSGDFVDNTDPLNPVLDRGYKVYTGYIYFIKGGDPILYGARENTIGEELTLTKISDGALNINFPQGTSLDNVWVSPLIFKSTNQGGKNDGDNFVTNTFLALQGERWDDNERDSPHRYCVALGSEYVGNIYMAYAVAEIEIRVYN